MEGQTPIGLMFEYSDYKTFQKSLNDGFQVVIKSVQMGKVGLPCLRLKTLRGTFVKPIWSLNKMNVEEVKQVKEKVISAVGGTSDWRALQAQAEVERNRPTSNRKASNKRPNRKPQPKRAPEPTRSSSRSAAQCCYWFRCRSWWLFGLWWRKPHLGSRAAGTNSEENNATAGVGEEDEALRVCAKKYTQCCGRRAGRA